MFIWNVTAFKTNSNSADRNLVTFEKVALQTHSRCGYWNVAKIFSLWCQNIFLFNQNKFVFNEIYFHQINLFYIVLKYIFTQWGHGLLYEFSIFFWWAYLVFQICIYKSQNFTSSVKIEQQSEAVKMLLRRV